MDEVRLVGRHERTERDLYVSVAHDIKTWSPELTRLRPFVALLAMDADTEENETLELLASHLIAAGCHYVCTWGPGCERMHDVVDEVWHRVNSDLAALPADAWDERDVMTTWHERESLDEALWYAIFLAHLEEHEFSSVVAVVLPASAEDVERRFAHSLDHFPNLDYRWAVEITTKATTQTVHAHLRSAGAPKQCYVLSSDFDYLHADESEGFKFILGSTVDLRVALDDLLWNQFGASPAPEARWRCRHATASVTSATAQSPASSWTQPVDSGSRSAAASSALKSTKPRTTPPAAAMTRSHTALPAANAKPSAAQATRNARVPTAQPTSSRLVLPKPPASQIARALKAQTAAVGTAAYQARREAVNG